MRWNVIGQLPIKKIVNTIEVNRFYVIKINYSQAIDVSSVKVQCGKETERK